MNKKLMAVAVAGALAAPAVAFAQASSVQIYGRANLGFDSAEAKGATAANSDHKRRNRVFDSSSRLGFQGTENLGMGLKAVFKIETGVNMDNGSNTGQHGGANAATGYLASREGWAGLAGNWGQVLFGRQNVWWTNLVDQTQANYINVGVQFATGGFGIMGAPTVRTNNTVKYISPTMGGFTGFLSYAPGSESAAANAETDDNITGATLTYRGRLLAQLDWAKNEVGTTERTGTKFGIGWPYRPGAILSAIFIQLKNEAGGAETKQDGWQLNWSHMFGNLQGMAQYGQTKDIDGTSNTGSKAWLVAAKYHLSKRTGVYVSYTQIKNESGQKADYTGGGFGVAPPGQLALGADPKIFAVGIQHNF
jgi:predicted porin